MQYIKDKLKRFWKWIVLAIGIPTVYAATILIPSPIPVDLQLKVPQANIGTHQIIVQFDFDEAGRPIPSTRREHVSYQYRSENPSERFQDEIIEKRTINTITQSLGNNQFVTTGFLGQRFYKETHNNDWYDVFYATTTVGAFNSQMQVSWLDNLFVKTVFADDTGFKNPGTVVEEDGPGAISWGLAGSAEDVKICNDVYFFTNSLGTSGTPLDETLSLTKGGTVQGDNKVVPTTITTTEAEISYGGAADLFQLFGFRLGSKYVSIQHHQYLSLEYIRHALCRQ